MAKRTLALVYLAVWGVLTMFGCAPSTRHIPAVTGFDPSRYMGTWCEIVRLPHSFEKGLSRVTATYTLNPDGTIQVINQGYDEQKGKWKRARAVARPTARPGVAELKVTFFWPFSGDYRVIALDPDYRFAVVTSATTKYFWILARTPTLDAGVLDPLLDQAREQGFDLTELVRVDQCPLPGAAPPPP